MRVRRAVVNVFALESIHRNRQSHANLTLVSSFPSLCDRYYFKFLDNDTSNRHLAHADARILPAVPPKRAGRVLITLQVCDFLSRASRCFSCKQGAFSSLRRHIRRRLLCRFSSATRERKGMPVARGRRPLMTTLITPRPISRSLITAAPLNLP